MNQLVWCFVLLAGLAMQFAAPQSLVAQSDVSPRSDAATDGSVRQPALPALAPMERVEIGRSRPLTLREVLESVDRHHPTIDGLQQRVVAAEGARLAAQGGFDPLLAARGSALAGYYQYGRLDVSIQQPTPIYGASFIAGYRLGRPFDESFPGYYGYDRTLDGGEVRVGVTVPLLRDGSTDARRAGVSRAEYTVNAASGELEARRLRLLLAASEAYFRWVTAGQRYAVVSQLLALADERDTQLAQRIAAGAIPAIERLENRRAILERRGALVAARRQLERTAIQLSLYLRDGNGAPIVARASAVPVEFPALQPISLDEAAAIELAVSRRPELARTRNQRDAARIAAELAQNQLLPRLDISLTGSVDLGTTSDAALRDQLSPPVGEGLLTFSMPLALREPRGRLAAARAEVAVLEAELELARDTIAIEVRDALSAIAAARENAALAHDGAEVSAQLAQAERTRFEGGLTTLFIVNLREASAAEASIRELDALAELAVSHAMFDAVTAR